jgi:DNA modification methylase
MIELNKIYNESNLETMAKMPDKSIDYVLTSPPYNVGDNKMFGKETAKYEGYTDKLQDYFENQKKLIDELLRVTKKHVIYNVQMLGNNKIDFLNLLGCFKDKIKDIIIWKKNGIPHIEQGIFNSSFEFIIIFSNDRPEKKKFYDANFKRGSQNNVFEILNKHSNPFAKEHKAIMPLDIPRYFMINFGKENDIWYDPYMGTGTTAVSAIEEKRNFIGSEVSKEYTDLANKRLKPYLQQTTLF